MVRQFEDTVSLLEVCLAELQRQEALLYAPFKPGDCIGFERDIDGTRKFYGPYMVIDVLPDKRARYSYDCVALTKGGAMFKRAGSARVSPDASTIVVASNVSLNDAGRWEAEYFRRCAQTSHQLAFLDGDVTLFEAFKDWLGTPHYERKDRLDP
jgi:hypothetical protein